jgi:hypothetical protein
MHVIIDDGVEKDQLTVKSNAATERRKTSKLIPQKIAT